MRPFIAIAASVIAANIFLAGCAVDEEVETKTKVSAESVQQAETVVHNIQVVSGTIYAKQPIAPASGDGYTVTVKLVDVSRMDVAAEVIGSAVFVSKHLPVEYSVSFDSAVIKPSMSYALQTHITNAKDELVAVTDQNHKYTLNDPSIGFDILVKAIQLEAPIPVQEKMKCGNDRYSLAIYPSVLVKTDLAIHNQHILPHVVSASGAHYKSDTESIFMKGDNPLLVEVNGERVDCLLD
jgi:uncharacterized lipoprotein YbaY